MLLSAKKEDKDDYDDEATADIDKMEDSEVEDEEEDEESWYHFLR